MNKNEKEFWKEFWLYFEDEIYCCECQGNYKDE